MPHHVLKGISSNEYAEVKTEIARVIIIIITKYPQVIDDNPVTKHRISSGKSGNKNISESMR